ncbi:hypothetical protein [Dactylosporangium darangshiense]|uniref:hypothetical protein n=1 Tax=Dactylosporangium darangshiense TaxID=579108 RepID=UPI0036433D8F
MRVQNQRRAQCFVSGATCPVIANAPSSAAPSASSERNSWVMRSSSSPMIDSPAMSSASSAVPPPTDSVETALTHSAASQRWLLLALIRDVVASSQAATMIQARPPANRMPSIARTSPPSVASGPGPLTRSPLMITVMMKNSRTNSSRIDAVEL